ncbi:MAG: N-acetylmuramoyl-L-alanine amidase [Trueperaceae bacterium]
MEGPLARFQRTEAQAPADLVSPEAPVLRPGPLPPRRTRVKGRRRQVLAAAFALSLMVLVGLNAAAALQDPGAMALAGGGSVRVLEPPWLRGFANSLRGPVRVGIQVGHLDAGLQPDELASLRVSTGAHVDGIDEVDINLAVAEALAARLARYGFTVDLLPATVPVRYRSDVLLSIHADASADADRRGYKSAHFLPARNAREPLLKVAVDRAVFAATGLPDDDRNVSGNMLHYYAFNHHRFQHAAAGSTPALLVELGYLSHPEDRRTLQSPDVYAAALEHGVLAYLRTVGRVD